MSKKQFKTESKKLLDMMVNSIYTHKEIFLRELISNASDAIDKLYFRSLTDESVTAKREDYEIRLEADKVARTLTVRDNGCGMTREELENNLGTIAKSGSFEFKKGLDGEKQDEVDVIGQFGVGFYSAFMVAKAITVESRAYGADEAYRWTSSGADGYTVEPCEKADFGTVVTLTLKDDTEDEKFGDYLEEWQLRQLVRKYSDYIHYPIRMDVTRSRKKADSPDDKPEYESCTETETFNSMVPIWKKNPADVTEDEYNSFYEDKFFAYGDKPLKVIRQKSEGSSEYTALLFIPSRAPFDYYTKDFEKGLELYSSGVMIMEKCKDLLPDYFGFVRGLVDSSDLSLNISREMLQHDRQLKVIARGIEKKIGQELLKMQEADREKYEQFWTAFGRQLKYGLYSDYGAHKDALQDLLMFVSSNEDKPVTLKEYVSRMREEQKKIYYAPGESIDRIKLLPQVEAVTAKGYEVLYLTEDVDEFALQMLHTYGEKEFSNVCRDDLDLATEDEKKALTEANDGAKDLLAFMQTAIGDAVKSVRFTNALKNHPACLSSEGDISVEMEKTLNRMPGAEAPVKAELALEINMNHPIAERLKALYAADQDKLAKYSKVLYAQARLISGLAIENAAEVSELVVEMMMD